METREPATAVDFRDCLPLMLVSGPAGLRARGLGRLVAAATAIHGGVTVHTAIRCRRRPLRHACQGHLLVRRQDVPAEIQWGCPECRDRGILRGYKSTPQDLSAQKPLLEPECVVTLDETEYRALEGILTLRPAAERIIMGAAYTPHGIRLSGRRTDLDILLDDIFAAAEDPDLSVAQATLDRAVLVIDRVRRAGAGPVR